MIEAMSNQPPHGGLGSRPRGKYAREEQRLDTGEVELKLSQKVPLQAPGPVQGWITNTYVSPDEYDVLATLAAVTLSKTRYSVP